MEGGNASVVPFVMDGIELIGMGVCRGACTTGAGGGSIIAF